MADSGWTGIDRWCASGDHTSISEQTVKVTKKDKCSAFGEAVVGSGRAEWDLTIDFESYGGIAIGVYRQELRDRDNINALPTEETFTYTPDGYGYANKTGAFTANKERQKYGIRYRNGDKVTVRLDLQSRTLTFLVNDATQGVAYEGLPKGAYRLACSLQFNQQTVIIQRFWTSLGKDATIPNLESTQTTTDVKDKVGKEHATVESPDYVPPVAPVSKKAAAATIEPEYKAPEIDPDAPMFGNDYMAEDDDDVYVPADSEDDDDDGGAEVSTKEESLDEHEKQRLEELEQGRPKNRRESSLEDVQNDISEQYGQELNTQLDELHNLTEEDYSKEEKEEAIAAITGNTDAVGLIGGRSRGQSQADANAPEPLSIETKEEDATDYFSLSGSNLKTDRSSVTCTRQTNGSAHSAFATQLVSRGRIEWMIKVDTGHSIRIGVCGSTDSTDRDFTQTKYGYGYGDDGNIYFGGSHIEYNDGFKAGDIIGVYLNMDMNTLKFSVNGADHGAAFDSINLDDKDNVIGYRLAISLQHRPHKLTLLDSTVYNVERRSPRPNSNQFGNNNGHQRKLSYASMNKLKMVSASSAKSQASDTPEAGASDGEKSSSGKDKKKKSDKDLKNGKKDAKNKKTDAKSSKKKTPSTSSAASKKKSAKNGATTASKKKTAASSGASKKKTSASSSSASKKKKTDAAAASSKKKLTTPAAKKSKVPSKKSAKKSASGDDEKKDDAWTERENVSKDSWVACGPKLVTEKLTVSTKTNIKDGNTAFGKLCVKNKMKAVWEVTVKQGDNIGIGVCNVNGALSTAKNKKLLSGSFTNDIAGYGYMGKDGGKQRQGRYKKYGQSFKSGDKVSVILDMSGKTLSFAVNGQDQGDAFKNLPSGDYRLALVFFEKSSKVAISKTTVYDL